jgi:hypothetical protein
MTPPTSLIRPLVRALHAYVPGEQPRIPGLIKLNTNENPYPPSPKVLAAVREATHARLRLYPNPTSQALREALAILDPQFAGNPQDRATVLATVDARLRLATLSTADQQETLARSGLAAIEAQTSGRTDPRLQALRVESLLLLQRGTEARTLGETLVASGYRDAGFMALLRTHDIASKR